MLTRRIEEMVRQFPENGMKFLLEDPANVRDLLALAGSDVLDLIDWSRLTLDRTTYVQRDYRHVEADIVMHAPLRRAGRARPARRVLIYVLIEHQSEPDRWMLLRVVDYVVQIYKAQRRRSAAGMLHPVLPVVFYTGDESWPDLGEFADLVERADRFRAFLPGLAPLFVNLRALTAEQLETEGGFFGWVLRLVRERHARPVEFRDLLERVVTYLETMPAAQKLRWQDLLSYATALVYHGREPAEQAELQQRINESAQTDQHRKELSHMGKTIADSLIERGRREEAVTSRQTTLLVLLRERFDQVPAAVEQTVKATKAVAKLNDWLKRVVKAQSLDDVGISGA